MSYKNCNNTQRETIQVWTISMRNKPFYVPFRAHFRHFSRRDRTVDHSESIINKMMLLTEKNLSGENTQSDSVVYGIIPNQDRVFDLGIGGVGKNDRDNVISPFGESLGRVFQKAVIPFDR